MLSNLNAAAFCVAYTLVSICNRYSELLNLELQNCMRHAIIDYRHLPKVRVCDSIHISKNRINNYLVRAGLRFVHVDSR